MTDSHDAQSRRAHQAVDLTASNVVAEIDKLFRKVIKLDVAPDVIREWLLLRQPSRPGELHPESLTDPDVILSHHPARATMRRLPPSIDDQVPPAAG